MVLQDSAQHASEVQFEVHSKCQQSTQNSQRVVGVDGVSIPDGGKRCATEQRLIRSVHCQRQVLQSRPQPPRRPAVWVQLNPVCSLEHTVAFGKRCRPTPRCCNAARSRRGGLQGVGNIILSFLLSGASFTDAITKAMLESVRKHSRVCSRSVPCLAAALFIKGHIHTRGVRSPE